MCDVRCSDVMMQEVNDARVRPVDGEECTSNPCPRVRIEVWNIHIRVLEPRVQDEPAIHDKVRENVHEHDWRP